MVGVDAAQESAEQFFIGRLQGRTISRNMRRRESPACHTGLPSQPVSPGAWVSRAPISFGFKAMAERKGFEPLIRL